MQINPVNRWFRPKCFGFGVNRGVIPSLLEPDLLRGIPKATMI